MAFTVEPPGAETIDLNNNVRDSKHLDVKYVKKFVSTETVKKIIVFDKLKDVNLQINGNGVDLWGLETTTTTGEGNKDITDDAVPWTVLLDIATNIADFQTGGGDVNRGILAVRLESVVLTDDFNISADQQIQQTELR